MERQSGKNGARAKKKSFLDLPAEVRNIIYVLNLKVDTAIRIRPISLRRQKPSSNDAFEEISLKFYYAKLSGSNEYQLVRCNSNWVWRFEFLGLMLVTNKFLPRL